MENKDYESLSTEELTEMLRKDCRGIAPLELDEIFSICEVVTKRRPQGKTVEEAHEEFVRIYLNQ